MIVVLFVLYLVDFVLKLPLKELDAWPSFSGKPGHGIWGASVIGGIFVGCVWAYWRDAKRDYIRRKLDKRTATLPLIIEYADYRDPLGRKDRKVRNLLKNTEIVGLLKDFEIIELSYHRWMKLAKKYGLDGYELPIVTFLKKDGSRVSVDGKDVFTGEDITDPAWYADILRKVITQYSPIAPSST